MPERPSPGRELLVCILNEPDFLHEVLAAFLEAGVPSSTVIESQGMGRILSHDVPVFSGFRTLFAGSKPFNHTILAVVNDRAVTLRAIELARDVLKECEDPYRGIIFTVPVSHFATLSEV